MKWLIEMIINAKFKTKYIADTELSFEERRLDVDKIVEIMKEKNIVAEEVYEIDPILVYYFNNDDGELVCEAVHYTMFIPLLVKEIQNLRKRVKILENKK